MASAARPSSCWPIRRSAGAEVRAIWPELSAIDPVIAAHLEIDAKYDVYLKRQTADVEAFRRDEGLVLADIDYAQVPVFPMRSAPSWRRRGRARSGRQAGSMA